MKIGSWNDSDFEIGTFNINDPGFKSFGSGNNHVDGATQSRPIQHDTGCRETGTIEKLLHSYGFIQCCDRKARLFFHASHLNGNMKDLHVGDHVEFEMTFDPDKCEFFANALIKLEVGLLENPAAPGSLEDLHNAVALVRASTDPVTHYQDPTMLGQGHQEPPVCMPFQHDQGQYNPMVHMPYHPSQQANTCTTVNYDDHPVMLQYCVNTGVMTQGMPQPSMTIYQDPTMPGQGHQVPPVCQYNPVVPMPCHPSQQANMFTTVNYHEQYYVNTGEMTQGMPMPQPPMTIYQDPTMLGQGHQVPPVCMPYQYDQQYNPMVPTPYHPSQQANMCMTAPYYVNTEEMIQVMPPSSSGGRPKTCYGCGIVGHVKKNCPTTDGGTVYMGDMPPSMTEEGLRVMVEEFGCIENLILRSYRDGGKWAMVNVRDKEEGQKIIDGLHMSQLKGRELTVKWNEEGMWKCRDPSCRKWNFEEREKCIKCNLKKKVENTKDESKCERSGKVSLPEVFDPELGKHVAVDKV